MSKEGEKIKVKPEVMRERGRRERGGGREREGEGSML